MKKVICGCLIIGVILSLFAGCAKEFDVSETSEVLKTVFNYKFSDIDSSYENKIKSNTVESVTIFFEEHFGWLNAKGYALKLKKINGIWEVKESNMTWIS